MVGFLMVCLDRRLGGFLKVILSVGLEIT